MNWLKDRATLPSQKKNSHGDENHGKQMKKEAWDEEQNFQVSAPKILSNGLSQAHPDPEYFAYNDWGRAQNPE